MIRNVAAMLNLITDPWIPVLRCSGRDVIRPGEIADPDVLRPDWPRPDLNLACYELLIGLVYLAHPPNGNDDRANPPDAAVLRLAMEPLAPAFNLLGDGPRFLQDLEPLDGEGSPPEMLFIDSAGDSTAKKNADLMVRRGRTKHSRCRWPRWRCTHCRHSLRPAGLAIARQYVAADRW